MNVILTQNKEEEKYVKLFFIYAHIYSALDGWMKENEKKISKRKERNILVRKLRVSTLSIKNVIH